MSAALSPEDAVARAATLLQQNQAPRQAIEALQGVSAEHPQFAEAQFLRAICTYRDGDPQQAKDLYLDAARRGERQDSVWIGLAYAAAAAGMPDDALAALLAALEGRPEGALFPFLGQVLRALGFAGGSKTPDKDKVFGQLLLPLLAELLRRRDMDSALTLESVIYEHYVKATETEAHFAWCMDRIAPLFTEAGRYWRETLPPLPQPTLAPPYRVGFFIHRASTLAHIEVLLKTLKGYRMLDEQPFEATVYCFSGQDAAMEAALRALDIKLVMLNERFPETEDSGWQRLLRLRELLAQDGIQELVWVSFITKLSLAFAMRIAPVQTWFAMKYRNFSHPDIDGYVSGSALTRFGTLAGRQWRTAMLGVDDWYDPGLEARAAEIRASLDAEVVLMTLARTEKMRDPAYLTAVARLLQAHPKAIFLWAGRDEDPVVTAAFRAAGVADRTRFIGWVNTRLYAQVADVFLDTFPFPCGFTLFQAMAAAKPVVIYDSPEAAQTGLWNFLQPLIDRDEGTPAERDELRRYVGAANAPLISVARAPDDFVRLAGRLVDDLPARAAAGEASRGFMARYFSDPRVMGSSVAQHFVELIEERAVRPPAPSQYRP